jgi:hypothetical protein
MGYNGSDASGVGLTWTDAAVGCYWLLFVQWEFLLVLLLTTTSNTHQGNFAWAF